MRNETRIAYNGYLAQVAKLNGVDSAAVKFNVEPSVQQNLETAIQESTALLGRISTPEQIASAVVWLLEPDCMVTGQQIVVDGGFMLGKPPSAAGATPASSGGAP